MDFGLVVIDDKNNEIPIDPISAPTTDNNNIQQQQIQTPPSNPPQTTVTPISKKLQSSSRILSLIKKAEHKKVAKRKIISFLKKKGVSERKIITAYSRYYKEYGLYEITFNERPLGFSVIMDTRGHNAIVSSVQDDVNDRLGMKVASRIYEVNGKRVDDLKHKEILKTIAIQQTPFYIVFREAKKRNRNLDKIQQKMDAHLTWVEEDDKHITNNNNNSSSDTNTNDINDDGSIDEDSDFSSYSSEDDEGIVADHYQRKEKHRSKQRRKANNTGLFKPYELNAWDQTSVVDEEAAMLKELSRLMLGEVASSTVASAHSTDPVLNGMTHKRVNTLRTLLDVTQESVNSSSTANTTIANEDLQKRRKFSVSELNRDDEEYDMEIFKCLQQLVGMDTRRMSTNDGYGIAPPMTPSASVIMRDLFADFEDDNVNNNTLHLHTPCYDEDDEPGSNHNDRKDDDNEDVIQSLESGATLLKYGKYGKPKYKLFQLTHDHKYLVWFSQKKTAEETRIPLQFIHKIAIGKESKVGTKTKKADILETSFTIFYSKSKLNTKQKLKQLTVTAKNEKEAYVWAQGLKILSDAAKRGQSICRLTNKQLNEESGINKHHKTKSVIISMDSMIQQSSLFNTFSKSTESSANSLLKQHARLKKELQKCVNFVMTKNNYKAILVAEQFEQVKSTLQTLDNVLRDIKMELTNIDASSVDDNHCNGNGIGNGVIADISSLKADLFSCNADLDALKQKLTAIVRRPQKL